MERGLSHRGLGPRGLHSQVGCPRRQRTRPVLWTAGPGTAPASGSRRRALSPGSQEAGPGWSGQPQGRTRRRGGRGRARTGADGGWGGPLGGRGREEAWALVGTEGREQTALPRARGRGGDLSGCGDRVSAPEGPQGALGSTRDLRPSAVDGPRPQGAAQGPPGTGLLGHPGRGRRAGFSGK